MAITIGTDSLYTSNLINSQQSSKSGALEKKLGRDLSGASDQELLDACKDFESYLVEQVVKKVKDTVVSKEEENNQYMNYFGDMMYEEIATQITESGQLGIANQLYEAMKRNQS